MKNIFSFTLKLMIFVSFPTDASLISHWNINNVSQFNDIVGNNHFTTFTRVTLGKDRFGNPQGAADFGGNITSSGPGNNITSFLSLPMNATLAPAEFSISFWFQLAPDQVGNSKALISAHTVGPQRGYQLAVRPETFESVVATAGNGTTQAVIDNQTDEIEDIEAWHMMTMTYDGSNMSLFLDAINIDTENSIGQLPVTSNPFTVGAASHDQDFEGHNFVGRIDDIRFYDHALSQKQIQNLFKTPVPATIWLFYSGLIVFFTLSKKT